MTDATYVKTRDTGRVVSVVLGVYSDGRREVYGMDYGLFWCRYFMVNNR